MTPFQIEQGTLYGCPEATGNITIPSNVIRIARGAFRGSSITGVSFEGNSVTGIEEEAFADCTQLASVILPDGLIMVGDNAFNGCSNLKYIVIPESLLVVGTGVLDHCGKFVIVGTGSEAEKLAKKYSVVLDADFNHATKGLDSFEQHSRTVETRSFQIFGETVTCSNTLRLYHQNMAYYESRKSTLCHKFISRIPRTVHQEFGDIYSVLTDEIDNTVNRLSEKGVFIQKEQISSYVVTPMSAIAEAVKSIQKAYTAVISDTRDEISSSKEALIEEAESKVTGLSYGRIGSSFDMLIYSIDDYNRRKKQRKEAYDEAEKKFAQIKKDIEKKGENTYSDFISQATPYLSQGLCMFIESLCEAENATLMNAGLIDQTAVSRIDIAKSTELMVSADNDPRNSGFKIALALQKYPCNVAAYVYALERKQDGGDLVELMDFMELRADVLQGIKKSREKKIRETSRKISTVKTADEGMSLIRDISYALDNDTLKSLLEHLADTLTRELQSAIREVQLNQIYDVGTYCSREIERIIPQKYWGIFTKAKVLPVDTQVIPAHYATNTAGLSQWMSEQINEKLSIVNAKYNSANHLLTRGKSVSDIKKAEELFKELGDYRDSQQKALAAQKAIGPRKKKTRFAVCITILSCIAIVIAIITVIIPSVKYKNAVTLMDAGNYDDAATVFCSINGFWDSEDQICKIAKYFYQNQKFSRAAELFIICNTADAQAFLQKPELVWYVIGNTVSLGNYHEPLNWTVLAAEGEKVLIGSEKYVDYRMIDSGSSRYGESDIYMWLNSSFLSSAFDKEERQLIQESKYGYAFLFSKNEKEQYYDNQGLSWDRDATAYAKSLQEEEGNSSAAREGWYRCNEIRNNFASTTGDPQSLKRFKRYIRIGMWIIPN